MKRTMFYSIAAVSCMLCATAAQVQTGTWINSFPVARDYAFETGTPLVFVWSNDICDHCQAFKASLDNAAFKTWQSAQPYVFCLVEGKSGVDTPANKGAKAFAMNAGGYGKKSSGGYPMVSLLWLEGDEVKAVSTFTGRPGKMGVAPKKEMYEEFIEAIETAFAEYGVSDLGYFPVTDTEYDRFEAEPSTGVARIPVDRAAAGAAAANSLKVTKDGVEVFSTDVAWSAGSSRAMVDVPLANIVGLSYDGTSTLEMTLVSKTDGTSTNGTIHLVAAQKNAVRNPYFPGERDLGNLDWADWTLDWTLVTDKVAKASTKTDKSYVLAVFSGTLWCPYCKGIETGLFDSPKFSAWLRDNKVQLVLFDQPLSATDAYAGNAQLLSYAAGLDHYSGEESRMRSGAGYLVRHGLAADDAAVLAVRERTASLTVDWRAPGSTAARLSNPTILLLDHRGTVLGRLSTWRDRNRVFGDDVRYYDPDENVARLNDLLKLAPRGGELDDYAATTTLEHKVGEESSAELQINSATRYWKITGAEPGTLVVTRTDASKNDVVFTLMSGTETIATGSETIEAALTSKMLRSSTLYLRATASGYSASVNPLISATVGGSVFQVSFETSLTPDPGVDNATLPMTFAASVVLEEIELEAGQTIMVKKTSGTIPSGLKLKYDKSLGAIVLYGTPSKAVSGAKFEYTVTVKTGRVKEVLEPVEVEVDVFDPKTMNPYLGSARSATVPLVTGDATLAGTLEVSTTAKSRVTAKYSGLASTPISFSGSWTSIEEDGRVVFSAQKNGVSLELSLDASGCVSASLSGLTRTYSDLAPEDGKINLSGETAFVADISRFAGYYTVAVPCASEAVAGTGYLTLKLVSASAVKKGKVSFSGVLPNGESISGNATLGADPDDPEYAILPVFKRTSSNIFSALLRIRSDGASYYSDEEESRVVTAMPSAVPMWHHTTSGDAYSCEVGIYGCWYPQKTSVAAWLEMFDSQHRPLAIGIAVPDGFESATHGGVASAPSAVLGVENKKGGMVIVEKIGTITLSFNATTAVFSGKATIVFEDGTSTSGAYKGVLTPGWLDCGCGDELEVRPFGSGTFYWTDRVNGKSYSLPVVID